MGTISLTLPTAGTVIAAGLHATNYSTLQALSNGGIDNNNFAAGRIFDNTKIMQGGALDKQALVWNNGATQWQPAYPPGYEWDYKEFTAPVSVTGTTTGTANTVIASNSVTLDGAAVWIEFWCYAAAIGGTSIDFELFVDATDIGDGTSVKTSDCGPVIIKRRYTPAAGAHTITVKAYVPSGTGTVRAGVGGGAGIGLPGYLRITKA